MRLRGKQAVGGRKRGKGREREREGERGRLKKERGSQSKYMTSSQDGKYCCANKI